MRAFVALVVLLAFALPVEADHCAAWSTSVADADTGLAPGAPRFYVVDLVCSIMYCPGTTFSIWVYEESNGIDGLQRADEVHDDTCHGSIAGDKIIL